MKKIEGLEFQMESDVNAIAHLATFEKDYHSNTLRVAAENEKLRRRVNIFERKSLEAVSSAKQLLAMVSAIAED